MGIVHSEYHNSEYLPGERLIFDNIHELEEFLQKYGIKKDIFRSSDGEYILEISFNDIEKIIQTKLFTQQFPNARDGYDYINKKLGQGKKPIGFLGDIIKDIKNNLNGNNNSKSLINKIKYRIGFLFDEDFQVDSDSNLKVTYERLKKIFGEWFYVFVLTTGTYSDYKTQNIILVSKNVRYYESDFEKYHRLSKNTENIE